MSSALCFNLDQSKILLSGNRLNGVGGVLTVVIERAVESAEQDQSVHK